MTYVLLYKTRNSNHEPPQHTAGIAFFTAIGPQTTHKHRQTMSHTQPTGATLPLRDGSLPETGVFGPKP